MPKMTTQTTAERLSKLSAADAMEQANTLCPESKRDQNWDDGSTIYTFADDSQLRVCGSEVDAL